MMRTSRLREHLARVSLVLAAVVGCGGSDLAGPGAGDVIVGPHTKVLDDETLARIVRVSDDRATIELSGATPQLDGLAAGDVIVAKVSAATPVGLLRKVVRVEREPLRLVTSGATLADAFERAHITLHRDLGAGDLKTPVTTQSVGPLDVRPLGGAGVSADGALTIGVNDLVLYDLDGKPETTHDQARVTGNVSVHPSIDLTVDISDFQLKEATLGFTGAESATLGATIDAGYTFDESRVVPAFTFAPITVPIAGVPVIVVPVVNVRFGAKAALTVALSSDATETASFQVGVGYKDGAWGTTKSGTFAATLDPPSIDGKVALKTYAGPELDLLLYGVTGPYANVSGYLALDADLAGVPCFNLHGGLESGLGVKIDLLGTNVVDYATTVSILDQPISSGSCQGSLPPDTFWSKVWSAPSSSPEGARVAATPDGGFVVVGRSLDRVFKVDAKGNLVWQHAFVDFRDTRSVVALADGSAVVVGADRFVVFDAQGSIVRARQFTAPASVTIEAHALAATKDGGFFVVGDVQGPTGYSDAWALKLDATGNVTWSKRIGGAGIEHADAAVEAPDGHLVLAGENGDGQGFAAAFAASGALDWQRQYGGLTTVQSFAAVAPAPDGLLLGGTIQEGPGRHGWLVRTLADGTMKGGTFGSIQYLPSDPVKDDFMQIAVNGLVPADGASEGYFGIGSIWDGKSTTTSQLWAFKVSLASDASATFDWSRGFDAAGTDDGYVVSHLADKTVLLGGTTTSLGTNPVSSLWFLRTKESGAITLPPGSPIASAALSSQTYQNASASVDGGVAPIPVVSSATSFPVADVAIAVKDSTPTELTGSPLDVRTLAP